MPKTVIELSWEKSERGFDRIDYAYSGNKIPKDIMVHLVMAHLMGRLKKKGKDNA
jgi:hypothetical protein